MRANSASPSDHCKTQASSEWMDTFFESGKDKAAKGDSEGRVPTLSAVPKILWVFNSHCSYCTLIRLQKTFTFLSLLGLYIQLPLLLVYGKPSPFLPFNKFMYDFAPY